MNAALPQTADRFGLDCSERDGVMRLSRDGAQVDFRLDAPLRDDVEARHHALCVCWGTRLGIDRLRGDYDFAEERPTAEDARNVYEMSSIYGERIQQLLPRSVVDLCGRIGEFTPITAPWVEGASSTLAFIRETRRHFHVLGEEDLPNVPYSRENLIEYSRYVLFYDAYKFRPREVVEESFADFKWYTTTDGQASSRTTLFPDFDLDAARAGGAFVITGRNEFVLAHPSDEASNARLLTRLRELARQAQQEEPQPFSRRVYALSTDGVTAGSTIDGRPELDASCIVDALVDVTLTMEAS